MTFVLSVFPGFGVGGAQARFCAVANHHGATLRHAIVAMDGNLACRERLDPGLLVAFPDVAVTKGSVPGTWRRLRAVLRELRPDVLLTHNFGSIDWAFANLLLPRDERIRHVHVEDGFGPDERDRQLRRRVWARRLALRRATVVLPSHVLMRIARDVWRLDERRLRYVPNGVDVARFAGPASGPAPWRLDGDGPVVGTVAALRPEKNIARLLRAVALVPAVRLVVVGDGPERAALTALAGSLGLDGRVAWVGHMADPAEAYRHMDIFALSSDTEQMPLSVLEAMAAGLPVAATDVGDVAGMVAEENRRYVAGCDDAMLASSLGQLAGNADLRCRVGTGNRRTAARDCDQLSMFDRWGGFLNNIGDVS